jgi:hypothetical protein
MPTLNTTIFLLPTAWLRRHAHGRPHNILDGGGSRSLSQLEILRAILQRVKCDLYPNEPEKEVLPCEYFQMMGGSDTGG